MDWQKDNESDGVYIFFLTQVVLYLRASELNSVQKGRVSTLGQFTLRGRFGESARFLKVRVPSKQGSDVASNIIC